MPGIDWDPKVSTISTNDAPHRKKRRPRNERFLEKRTIGDLDVEGVRVEFASGAVKVGFGGLLPRLRPEVGRPLDHAAGFRLKDALDESFE